MKITAAAGLDLHHSWLSCLVAAGWTLTCVVQRAGDTDLCPLFFCSVHNSRKWLPPPFAFQSSCKYIQNFSCKGIWECSFYLSTSSRTHGPQLMMVWLKNFWLYDDAKGICVQQRLYFEFGILNFSGYTVRCFLRGWAVEASCGSHSAALSGQTACALTITAPIQPFWLSLLVQYLISYLR